MLTYQSDEMLERLRDAAAELLRARRVYSRRKTQLQEAGAALTAAQRELQAAVADSAGIPEQL